MISKKIQESLKIMALTILSIENLSRKKILTLTIRSFALLCRVNACLLGMEMVWLFSGIYRTLLILLYLRISQWLDTQTKSITLSHTQNLIEFSQVQMIEHFVNGLLISKKESESTKESSNSMTQCKVLYLISRKICSLQLAGTNKSELWC